MAYVQCTLLHIPAVILQGDTLRGEVSSAWYTLAYVLGCWDGKLARDHRTAPEKEPPIAPAVQMVEAPAPLLASPTKAPRRQLTLF